MCVWINSSIDEWLSGWIYTNWQTMAPNGQQILSGKYNYQFQTCFTQSAILSQYVQKLQEWANFWHTKSASPMCVELDNVTH